MFHALSAHSDFIVLQGLGLKQFYGEELDRELAQIEQEISKLKNDSDSIRQCINQETVLESDEEVSSAIENVMERADSIRTLLLEYKKDGRSRKATLYNDVLKNFINSIQDMESAMIEYEKQLHDFFNKSDSVMSVKKIGDAHYLFRENPLEKYGYGKKEDRLAKLENLHTSIAQLKAMLVGLEFLAYSADKSTT